MLINQGVRTRLCVYKGECIRTHVYWARRDPIHIEKSNERLTLGLVCHCCFLLLLLLLLLDTAWRRVLVCRSSLRYTRESSKCPNPRAALPEKREPRARSFSSFSDAAPASSDLREINFPRPLFLFPWLCLNLDWDNQRGGPVCLVSSDPISYREQAFTPALFLSPTLTSSLSLLNSCSNFQSSPTSCGHPLETRLSYSPSLSLSLSLFAFFLLPTRLDSRSFSFDPHPFHIPARSFPFLIITQRRCHCAHAKIKS